MLWAILDKIPENPGLSLAITIVNQLVSAVIYLPILFLRERRTGTKDLQKRTSDFMDRQEEENCRLREAHDKCERARMRDNEKWSRNTRLLQDQITEMGDYLFEKTGHRFKAEQLPESEEEPVAEGSRKHKKRSVNDKDTDDAIDALPDTDEER